ncbi:dof zinc finger protein DOF5.2-like [Hibiscus syriacus]|uniref:Dof zinc finger protein DOF5.2-like n=1 Tax=Hibiscus syriacus TaxID=106335 RepID=A0A6A3D2W6_HIBSY|nr:dof zinc finger protein DOF5.2-like [Hibiscus syriacus]
MESMGSLSPFFFEEEEEFHFSKSSMKDHVGVPKVCSRGHWKPSEDSKLKELVALYGPQNWNLIAEKLQGRTGKSCRLRWFNQLDPRINKKAFTEEEEERLMAAHRAFGNKWAMIARLFPGRTDNADEAIIMQQSCTHQGSAGNFSDSMASASQVTVIEPSSPSATHFETITVPSSPTFIDFLGVGA